MSISVSLVFIVQWQTISGNLISLFLRNLGLDPTTASATFAATLVAVTGLIIHFTIAGLSLTGKMLK